MTADFTDMDPEKVMFFSLYMSELDYQQQQEMKKQQRAMEAKTPRRR